MAHERYNGVSGPAVPATMAGSRVSRCDTPATTDQALAAQSGSPRVQQKSLHVAVVETAEIWSKLRKKWVLTAQTGVQATNENIAEHCDKNEKDVRRWGTGAKPLPAAIALVTGVPLGLVEELFRELIDARLDAALDKASVTALGHAVQRVVRHANRAAMNAGTREALAGAVRNFADELRELADGLEANR